MSILEQLPAVRGSYTSNEPMSKHTWFGVGGPADIIFNPIDEDDLVHFLTGCPHEIPLFTVGAGSNLLVRDGGITGVVVKLSTHMKHIKHDGTCITAQTGATDADVARYAQKAGIGGLEFLIGIPGTIGGGLRMNAGAYGSEFSDITIRAHGFDREGNRISATPAEMGMAYRHSDAPNSWIFTSAELQGKRSEYHHRMQRRTSLAVVAMPNPAVLAQVAALLPIPGAAKHGKKLTKQVAGVFKLVVLRYLKSTAIFLLITEAQQPRILKLLAK